MAGGSSSDLALPGDRLLIYYRGEDGDYDDVWHERLLLWPAFGSYWAVRTPDGDEYVEDPLAHENLVRFLPPSGAIPRRADLGAQVYRFAAHPEGDAFTAWYIGVRKAHPLNSSNWPASAGPQFVHDKLSIGETVLSYDVGPVLR